MSQIKKLSTPSSLGYAMPAEWEPHRGTWLSWPHNLETWPPTQLTEVQEAWVKVIEALSRHEQVCLLTEDEQTRQHVTLRLKNGGTAMEQVSMLVIPTVDVWMRDYGPTFVTRAGAEEPLALNDWVFNGWGGKYRSYENDDRVTREIASLLNIPVFDHEIVLEGGSIEVNGRGTCLTTEQCLLNKNRNPHMGRGQIEQFLEQSLGVRQVIWLGDGIAGDDTDGHIDDIARFVNPSTIVCILESNPQDPNYRPLQENFERLQGARDQDGKKFTIVPLPSPRPIYYQGSQLPASYANFYIANQQVLVPTFDDPNDETTLRILQELFDDRQVIGVGCREVVAGLGGIHCVTQQEPRI